MTKARLRVAAPIRIVFDGQSMNNVPAVPNNMPTYLMNGRKIPWSNVAISGYGWQDLTPTAATRLFPQARNKMGCIDILIMCGGQGDILNQTPNGQQSGATTYTRAIAYANAARGAGFHYILTTTMPAIGPDVLGTGRPNATEQQAIQDYNDLTIANSGGFDAVADISIAPLNNATNSTYFDIDRTHFKVDGAKVAAALIAPTLNSLLEAL